MNPTVSIIIVSFNKLSLLKATLDSVTQRTNDPAIEVIVVDNASSEDNVGMVRQDFPSVRLVQSNINVGFGSGCNLGVKHSSGRYLLFVNSDITMKGNPLPKMLSLFESDSMVGIVGLQLLNDDGTRQPSYFRFPGLRLRFLQLSGLKRMLLRFYPAMRFKNNSVFDVDFVSGAFFLIPRSLFERIGGFDPQYFMYCEDADICCRVHRLGKRVVVQDSTDVIHLGAHFEDVQNPFLLFHYNRSQIVFYRKNYSLMKLWMLALMSVVWTTGTIWYGNLRGRDSSVQDSLRRVRKMYLCPTRDIDSFQGSVSAAQGRP